MQAKVICWLHIREVVGAMDVGVVGSGISGLAAAWLLAQRHRMISGRASRQAQPYDVGGTDTGFIVYEAT
ncbi:MAG: NAD(P)-binding protein [Sphingobium sp.]|nr:NAD(P)-binding protein [Sphingobium sp.]